MWERRVIAVLLLLPLVWGTTGRGATLMDPPVVDGLDELPAHELLPPGTVLQMVSLPRFVNHRLSFLVTSPYMKVESKTEFSGRNVMSYIFDETQQLTTKFYMQDASYFFDKKLLVSRKTTILQDFRIEAVGTGMTFDPIKKIGFMPGPGKVIIHKKQ